MLDDSAAKLYFLGDDVLESQRAVEHTSLAAQLVAFPEVRCAHIVCYCNDSCVLVLGCPLDACTARSTAPRVV